MANTKVRGITIELSADASGVVNGLKDVNSSIKTTRSELRDIEKLLKLDPTNTELLAQKYEALQRQITNTEDKIGLLRKAEEDLKKQMVDGGTEEQQKQLAALDREIISAEQDLKKYTNQLSDAEGETKDLTTAEEKAEKTTSKLGDGFTVLKGVVSQLVADGLRKAADALKDMATEGARYADDILTLSSTTSLSTEQLQKFSYMSGLVDVDLNTIAGSMRRLTKNMSSAADGTGSAYDAFSQLGVSFTDMNGSLRDNEDVFYDVIDALGKMENETERDALAMDLFGKSATDLNPLIEAGSEQLEAFGKEAEDVGYVLSDDMLNNLGNLQDQFDRFGKRIETVKYNIGAGLAPALERAMNKINDFIKKVDWEAVGKRIGGAFDKLVDIFTWLLDHGDAVIAVVEGIGAAMVAIKISEFLGLGGMITAIAGALIGGATALIAWGKAEEEARIASIPLISETRELADAIAQNQSDVDALTESYNSMNEAREQSLSSIETEAKYSETLLEQLNGLVDANGEIKEGEEERAKVLLNQLNSALGTEYEITDGMIDNYDELKQSVYELIEAKKQEAQMTVWTNQLETSTQGLIDAQRELEDISYRQAEANRQLEEAQLAYNLAVEEAKAQGTSDFYVQMLPAVKDARLAVNEATQAVADADAQFNATKATALGFAYSSEQALNNMAYITEGAMDKIETASYETFQAMGNDSSEYEKAVMENVSLATVGWQEALAEQLGAALNAQVEFKEAGNGTVTAYVDGQKLAEGLTQKEAEALADIVEKGMASGDFEGTGMDAVRGFAGGLGNTQLLALVTQRANEMARKAINAAKSTLEIQSPSKVFEQMGEFVGEGLAEGIEDSTKLPVNATKDMAKDVTKAFSTNLTTPNISGGVNSMMNYGVNMQSKDLSAMLGLLQQYLPTLANTQIVMDSGELVGSIAPKMSQQFNKLDTMAIRGTI